MVYAGSAVRGGLLLRQVLEDSRAWGQVEVNLTSASFTYRALKIIRDGNNVRYTVTYTFHRCEWRERVEE